MALVVEDGTGKINAESYISVADATAYHAARGNAAWSAIADDSTREQYLRKATDYMQQKFQGRWKGYKTNTAQALDWPRITVQIPDMPSWNYVAPDVIPVEVQNACAEFALRVASGDLWPDLTRGEVRVKVGSLEVEYDRDTPQSPRYIAVNAMMAKYMLPQAGTIRLVRS